MARVYAIAQAFTSWGIVKGDRIALLAENRWEWPVVDFATLVLGAADVPIYPTLTAEQIASLLIDSGARVAVVSTESTVQQDCLHPRPDTAGAHHRHGRYRRPGMHAALLIAQKCRRCRSCG